MKTIDDLIKAVDNGNWDSEIKDCVSATAKRYSKEDVKDFIINIMMVDEEIYNSEKAKIQELSKLIGERACNLYWLENSMDKKKQIKSSKTRDIVENSPVKDYIFEWEQYGDKGDPITKLAKKLSDDPDNEKLLIEFLKKHRDWADEADVAIECRECNRLLKELTSSRQITSSMEEEFEEAYSKAFEDDPMDGFAGFDTLEFRIDGVKDKFKKKYNLTDEEIEKLEKDIQYKWQTENNDPDMVYDMGEMYGAPRGANSEEALKFFESKQRSVDGESIKSATSGLKITNITVYPKWITETSKNTLYIGANINGKDFVFPMMPSWGYTPQGVDCDECLVTKLEGGHGGYAIYDRNAERINHVAKGGGSHSYALNIWADVLQSAPKENQKDFRFTGQYYSTKNVPRAFKSKLMELYNNGSLEPEFLEAIGLGTIKSSRKSIKSYASNNIKDRWEKYEKNNPIPELSNKGHSEGRSSEYDVFMDHLEWFKENVLETGEHSIDEFVDDLDTYDIWFDDEAVKNGTKKFRDWFKGFYEAEPEEIKSSRKIKSTYIDPDAIRKEYRSFLRDLKINKPYDFEQFIYDHYPSEYNTLKKNGFKIHVIVDLTNPMNMNNFMEDFMGNITSALDTIKVTFDNGDVITTDYNTDVGREEIAKYYMGNYFNIGNEDEMHKVVKVEFPNNISSSKQIKSSPNFKKYTADELFDAFDTEGLTDTVFMDREECKTNKCGMDDFTELMWNIAPTWLGIQTPDDVREVCRRAKNPKAKAFLRAFETAIDNAKFVDKFYDSIRIYKKGKLTSSRQIKSSSEGFFSYCFDDVDGLCREFDTLAECKRAAKEHSKENPDYEVNIYGMSSFKYLNGKQI